MLRSRRSKFIAWQPNVKGRARTNRRRHLQKAGSTSSDISFERSSWRFLCGRTVLVLRQSLPTAVFGDGGRRHVWRFGDDLRQRVDQKPMSD